MSAIKYLIASAVIDALIVFVPFGVWVIFELMFHSAFKLTGLASNEIEGIDFGFGVCCYGKLKFHPKWEV